MSSEAASWVPQPPLALTLGAFTPFLYGFRDREKINDIFEKTCGARLTMSYICPGGGNQDLEADFERDTRAFIASFPPLLDEYDRLLTYRRP